MAKTGYSRGWETIFYLSEVGMILLYIFGTRYEDGAQGYATNEADFVVENERADNMMQQTYPMW
jgi:hypothetical protein